MSNVPESSTIKGNGDFRTSDFLVNVGHLEWFCLCFSFYICYFYNFLWRRSIHFRNALHTEVHRWEHVGRQKAYGLVNEVEVVKFLARIQWFFFF